MTLVNLAALTAALAERDAARAEVERLRAVVRKVRLMADQGMDSDYRNAANDALSLIRAATEDQP